MATEQATLWDGARMTLTRSIELTTESMNAYGPLYDHWVIAFSGGKDSTALATIIPHLIKHGLIPKPKSLTVLYADTRMELPPLQNSALSVMAQLEGMGIKCRVVLPEMDDRFFVYMFGRGVPPPSNTFRWCTAQIKIEPMMKALKALRDETGEKLLMLTGVRIGESAVRDARISLSCGKNNAECGQGWFQISTPESIADTLAPLIHWRVCLVWKWLRQFGPMSGFNTEQVADAYGGTEAEEVNCRTGCAGCNLASRDTALEEVLKNPQWKYLQPLMRLRPLYAELKKPRNRLRKTMRETRKDGSLVTNPNRMGPLTMDARRWGLLQVLKIQEEINANSNGSPYVVLIDPEEQARILELIERGQWPNGWTGKEERADALFTELHPDGSIQESFMKELLEDDEDMK